VGRRLEARAGSLVDLNRQAAPDPDLAVASPPAAGRAVAPNDAVTWLVVKGKAGMGNRMLALITGVLYARLSGRRLFVDWSDYTYSSAGENAFLQFFRCPDFDPSDTLPESDSVAPPLWRTHLSSSVSNVVRELGPHHNARMFWKVRGINLRRLEYPEQVVVMWDQYERINWLRPYFLGRFAYLGRQSTRRILADLLRHDLVLDPAIQARVDHFAAAHFGQPTVGVHVRFGERRVAVEQILAAVARLRRSEPEVQIFLCTDNIDVKAEVERRFDRIVSTPHWYPPAGKDAHQNPDCPDRLEQGVEALVDMYLLARCPRLILDSRSTFSLVALLLSNLPLRRILDVNRKRQRLDWLDQLLWQQLRLGDVLSRVRPLLRRSRLLERAYDR
jgi:hypothetical protein